MQSTVYLPFLNPLKGFAAPRVGLLQFAIIHIWYSEILFFVADFSYTTQF